MFCEHNRYLGKRIVSGSDDKTLKVWDATTGQETLTLRGHTGRVSSLAFSPDGRRLAGRLLTVTRSVTSNPNFTC